MNLLGCLVNQQTFAANAIAGFEVVLIMPAMGFSGMHDGFGHAVSHAVVFRQQAMTGKTAPWASNNAISWKL
jgi:hypothetical protein